MNKESKLKIKTKVLLLEDDRDLQELIRDYFTPRGYEIICHTSAESAEKEILFHSTSENPIELVITDFRLPNMNGLELIVLLKRIAPEIQIILVTAHSSLDLAVEAIEKGAFDYVVKPIQFAQLSISMERALYVNRLQRENNSLKLSIGQSQKSGGFVARSRSMLSIIDLAKRVAASNSTVLIQGESGTGKEVLAQLIHSTSSRANQPFIAINCSAIPETLLESELFGHAKGSFTGADDKKIGLFEEAASGTLFLDEIGDLSLSLQAKLLRVIQERKIKRVGENQYRSIDVRILTATHKNLSDEVKAKRFREDLFFRLNVIPIKIPSLRERPEDILPLANHFLSVFRERAATKISGFSKKALHALLKNKWVGNVRELENTIERAVVLCDSEWIDESHFLSPFSDSTQVVENPTLTDEGIDQLIDSQSQTFQQSAEEEDYVSPSVEVRAPSSDSQNQYNSVSGNSSAAGNLIAPGELISLETLEMRYIKYILNEVEGVKEKAAKILEVDRKTLYRKLIAMDAVNFEVTSEIH